MKIQEIDLRSDTVTQPSTAMKEFMLNAKTGDDGRGGDPTAIRLQHKAASLFKKSASLFFPSGTMSNQAAIMSLKGEEIFASGILYLARGSHLATTERLSTVEVGRFELREIGRNGYFDSNELQKALSSDADDPRPKVVAVENPIASSGGMVIEQSELESILSVAHQFHTPTFLDGARIFNAASALNVNVAELTKGFDAVSFCLSKGLGAPVGSVLVSSNTIIERAIAVRHILGGQMRQIGSLAAAGIYALDHNIARLSEDHEQALHFSQAIQAFGFSLASQVDTNFVIFTHESIDGHKLVQDLSKKGILLRLDSENRLKAVFHLGITRSDVERLINELRDSVNE